MINFKDNKGNVIISLKEMRVVYDTSPIIWGGELKVSNSLVQLMTKVNFELLELQEFHNKLIKLIQGERKIIDFISSDNQFQLKLIKSDNIKLYALVEVSNTEELTRIELSFITDQTIIMEIISDIAQIIML